MSRRSFLLALLALVFCSTQAGDAALPISVYKEMQAKAPEHLEIEVTEVKYTSTESLETRTTDYRVNAVIKKVHRTGAKVSVGDTIQIKYRRTVRKPGFEQPGPAPNPGVAINDAGPAYLKRVDGQKFFTLAAEAYSFERLP